jgi:hypothetical protein
MNTKEQIREVLNRLGNGLTGNEALDAIMAIVQQERDASYSQGRQEGNDEARSTYHDMGR